MTNNKQKILDYVNSTNHYNRISSIVENVGISYSTANKWVKILLQERQIRRVNLGVYSPSYVYISLETSEEIRKSNNKW